MPAGRLWAGIGASAGAALAAAVLWWCWPSLGEPLSHLPVAAAPLRVAEDGVVERGEGRAVRRLVLDGGALGRARLAISLPDPLPHGPVPVLFIMGGLRTGENAIRHVDQPGSNALVGFGYPIDRRAGSGLRLAWDIPALRGQIFATPGLAAAALAWVRAQPWADPDRVTPVGVSLGAIFMPAVLRSDRAQGGRAGHAVLAYGGADLGLLAAHWLDLPAIIGRVAALGLAPVDPAAHLARLGGEFLVAGSAGDDALVPAAAARRLAELTPEPKTVIGLPGGHVGGEAAVTRRLTAAVRAWLEPRGMFLPP